MKNKNYESQMEHIKDWCVVILDFIVAKNINFKEFTEPTKDNLNKYYKNNSQRFYKGFQQSYRDINEMAKFLTPLEYEELNAILNEKFGKDLNHINPVIDRRIAKVLKIGKISNLEEYELLLNRVEEIYSDTSKADEI
nr:hypothetical protein [Pedobacter sp. ASV19]